MHSAQLMDTIRLYWRDHRDQTDDMWPSNLLLRTKSVETFGSRCFKIKSFTETFSSLKTRELMVLLSKQCLLLWLFCRFSSSSLNGLPFPRTSSRS